MTVLPPGTLLQLMYLEERISRIPPGHFIEIGPGNGEITQLLLDHGWTGRSFDIDTQTITKLKSRFAKEISEQRFTAVNADYLLSSPQPSKKADLIISSMVMEHLEDDVQSTFMQKSIIHLCPKGIMIGLVPGSPAHWGIEDEIAGHCRRYTRTSIKELADENNWTLMHIAGLTYPISNCLLPISNFLVNRSERQKLTLSNIERTKLSGRRNVKFKTNFPLIFQILLNKFTLFPLHLMQKLFKHSNFALVIYFEMAYAPQK